MYDYSNSMYGMSYTVQNKRRVEWLQRPVKVVVGLANSGVGLERKKNKGTVSLRVVVVLVERGVNLGWIVKRQSKLV
jgi:hypothetical protein